MGQIDELMILLLYVVCTCLLLLLWWWWWWWCFVMFRVCVFGRFVERSMQLHGHLIVTLRPEASVALEDLETKQCPFVGRQFVPRCPFLRPHLKVFVDKWRCVCVCARFPHIGV